MKGGGKSNYSIVFLGSDEERVKKVGTCILRITILKQRLRVDNSLQNGRVQIVNGDLLTGFELSMQKVAVMTEEELFTKRTKRSPSRQKLSNAERIKSYSELKVGDYVVHVNHGIGKYLRN